MCAYQFVQTKGRGRGKKEKNRKDKNVLKKEEINEHFEI